MTEDFRVRFLVVDDQQSIRKLCMTIGKSLGFQCFEAESAEAALALLELEAPDIILCDLKMAQMSGLEFLSEVRKKRLIKSSKPKPESKGQAARKSKAKEAGQTPQRNLAV